MIYLRTWSDLLAEFEAIAKDLDANPTYVIDGNGMHVERSSHTATISGIRWQSVEDLEKLRELSAKYGLTVESRPSIFFTGIFFKDDIVDYTIGLSPNQPKEQKP